MKTNIVTPSYLTSRKETVNHTVGNTGNQTKIGSRFSRSIDFDVDEENNNDVKL